MFDMKDLAKFGKELIAWIATLPGDTDEERWKYFRILVGAMTEARARAAKEAEDDGEPE